MTGSVTSSVDEQTLPVTGSSSKDETRLALALLAGAAR